MGSDSDADVVLEAARALDEFGVPCEVHVLSAHRTPQQAHEYSRSARDRGLQVIIAGAGGAAHLAGVMAAGCCGAAVIAASVMAMAASGAAVIAAVVIAAALRGLAVTAADAMATAEPGDASIAALTIAEISDSGATAKIAVINAAC